MKSLIFFIGSVSISLVLTWIAPWYLMIVGPLLMAFILITSIRQSFILGFGSSVAFWGILMLIYSEGLKGNILERIAYLIPLNGSVTAIIFLTLLIGGILGGLAGMNGAFWRKSMRLERYTT